MNKFKFSNYKLPHMAPITFKKMVKEKRKPIESNIPQQKLQVPIPIKQTVSSAGTETDSIRSIQAFKDEFGNYMGREFRGNDERLGKITPKQNYDEAMRELGEKYFDLQRGKLRLVPTDDAEMQDENFKSKLKSYQLFNPEMFSDQQPKDE
tara:strand:- start:41 stop:493 length:453 start_codon:yes stop_codon:yes gene_type:complete